MHTFRGVLLWVLLDDELGGDHNISEMQLHVPLIEVDLCGVGLLEGLPISFDNRKDTYTIESPYF